MSLWKLPQVYGQPPSARWGHTTTVFKQNKQLLVIGGWDGMRMLNDSFVLDLDFMAWTKVEISGDAPCARAGHSMSFVNENKIILFGGGDGSNYLNDLYVFDGETMTWSKPETKGKPPAPRSRHTATVVGNKLFIMGGGSNSRIFDDLYILDTDTMEWSQPETKGESPIPRWGHTCTLIKDKLYVFGGVVNGRMLNELFTLDTATLEYKRVDTEYLPAPRAGHSCISYADRYLFVLWGGDDKSFLNDLYIIDTEKLTGARMKFTTPKPRCAHSCTIVGENVYAYGGGDGTTRFKELYTLNAAKAIEKSGIKNITRPASSMVGSSSASAPAVTTPSADEQKSDSTNANNNNNNSSSSSSSSTARSPVKSEKQEVAKLATDDNANATLSKPTIDERDAGISPLRSAEHLEKRRRGSKIHAKSSSRSISDDFALQQQQQQQQQQQEQQQGLYNQEEAYGHIIHHTYGQKEAEEITRWLDGIGLVKYAGLFIREEVDLDTLPLLREHDLIRMGVAALGPRKKILLGIANLARLRGTATTTTTTTSSSLVSVLEETSAAALATELSFINHSISNLARSMEQLQESIKTLSVVYSINNNNNNSSSSPSRNIPILAGGHPFAPSAYMAPARHHHHHQVVHAHQYYANATTHQEQAEAEGEEQHKQQQIVDQEAAQCQLQQQQEQAEQQRQQRQQQEEERDFINELANKNKGNLSSSSNNNSISRHDASGRPDEHHEGSIDNEADVSTAEDTKPENEIVEYDREDVAAANNAAVAGKGDDDAVEAEEVAVPDAQMLRVDDGATDGLLESGASGAGEQVDHHDGEHQQQQGQHLYFHHEAAMDNEHPHEDDEAAAATAAAMAMAIQQQQQQYHQQYHHHHHRHQQQQQQELANSPYYLYYQHHLQQQQQQQPTSPYYYYRMHPHPVYGHLPPQINHHGPHHPQYNPYM